jgi:hypothetical protein
MAAVAEMHSLVSLAGIIFQGRMKSVNIKEELQINNEPVIERNSKNLLKESNRIMVHD